MSLDVGLQLPLAGVVCLSGYLHFQPTTDRHPFPPPSSAMAPSIMLSLFPLPA